MYFKKAEKYTYIYIYIHNIHNIYTKEEKMDSAAFPLPGQAYNNDAIDIYVPESLNQAKEMFEKVTTTVDNMHIKMSNCLGKQQTEFLAAYRAHMHNVQKELARLRQKVIDVEEALQKNEKIHRLEEDCEWFRSEAIRLDGYSTAMKKDLKYMKDKIDVLEEERLWYSKQLKTAKRHNRILIRDIEDYKNSNTGGVGVKGDQQQQQQQVQQIGGGHGSNTNTAMMMNSLTYSVDRMTKIHPDNLMDVTKDLPKNNSGSNSHHVNKNNSMKKKTIVTSTINTPKTTKVEPHKKDILQRVGLLNSLQPQTSSPSIINKGKYGQDNTESIDSLNEEIINLKKALKEEEKKSTNLRSKLIAHQVHRGELEELFEGCVEEVKKEVARRKRKANEKEKAAIFSRNKNILSPITTTKAAEITIADSHKNNLQDFESFANGNTKGSDESKQQHQLIPPPIKLEDLTAPDRLDIMARLCSNPNVLHKLYDHMFPQIMQQQLEEKEKEQGKLEEAKTSPKSKPGTAKNKFQHPKLAIVNSPTHGA